jgi:hypothetical protein
MLRALKHSPIDYFFLDQQRDAVIVDWFWSSMPTWGQNPIIWQGIRFQSCEHFRGGGSLFNICIRLQSRTGRIEQPKIHWRLLADSDYVPSFHVPVGQTDVGYTADLQLTSGGTSRAKTCLAHFHSILEEKNWSHISRLTTIVAICLGNLMLSPNQAQFLWCMMFVDWLCRCYLWNRNTWNTLPVSEQSTITIIIRHNQLLSS